MLKSILNVLSSEIQCCIISITVRKYKNLCTDLIDIEIVRQKINSGKFHWQSMCCRFHFHCILHFCKKKMLYTLNLLTKPCTLFINFYSMTRNVSHPYNKTESNANFRIIGSKFCLIERRGFCLCSLTQNILSFPTVRRNDASHISKAVGIFAFSMSVLPILDIFSVHEEL